jgi:hypothetical protein
MGDRPCDLVPKDLKMQLESARSRLMQIAAKDVRPPTQPMDVYLEEVEDLLAHISENSLRTLLVDEGLDEALLDEVPQALVVAREAQTAWTLTYERQKPATQKEAERRGQALRAAVAKKARFALRHDGAALAVLDQILEGDGIADLVQDLGDLRMLLTQKAEQFARNKNFDAVAVSGELAVLAQSIRQGLSGFRMSPEQANAVDLRNRAWTYLDDLVDDVREAGRAATEGKLAKGFSSAYERRMRARRRRSAATPAEPTVD